MFGEALWIPSADVYRTRDGWAVKIDLAGVTPEDVAVRTEGKRLIVAGRRRDRLVEAGWIHYHMEISYNRFERAIELPCDLTGATLACEHRDGMLIVALRFKP